MEWIILLKIGVALTLKTVNIIIHSVGICLLRNLQKHGRGDEYMIYLTTLSISELSINIVSFTRNLLKMILSKVFTSLVFEDAVVYSYIADYTILKFSLYMTMVVMSLDRMFLVILNISYPIWWSRKKAKVCVGLIWIAGILMFIITSIFYANADMMYHRIHLGGSTSTSNIDDTNMTSHLRNGTLEVEQKHASLSITSRSAHSFPVFMKEFFLYSNWSSRGYKTVRN